ncbi:MAG: hypothetical protein VB009_03805 [Erysipelotrichaceae bacterium]|nr:hypothetical protein [Erysipelotrichaceae bacterium]
MRSINDIITIITFIMVVIFGLWFLRVELRIKSKASNNLVKRLKQRKINMRKILPAIIIACGFALLVDSLVNHVYISLSFYLLFLVLIPYLYYADLKRKSNEELFRNVILYSHNMGMLLNESRNVYYALTTVQNDLSEPLRSDVLIVIEALSNPKNEAEIILKVFETKHPYSIIKHLNVIILHMHYENDHIAKAILDTFYNDIKELNKEFGENMIKRKTLRLQYIMISFGSLAAYWFMYLQLSNVFKNHASINGLNTANAIYLLITIMVMLLVDNYFNTHITRE